MNWYQVKTKWRSVKGKACREWDLLSYHEIESIAGDRAQLIGKLEQQYGLAPDEAARRADDWARNIINS